MEKQRSSLVDLAGVDLVGKDYDSDSASSELGEWYSSGSEESNVMYIIPTDDDGFMSVSDVVSAPLKSELYRGRADLPKKSLKYLKDMAIQIGIKKDGISWSKCFPPTGNKADIIKIFQFMMDFEWNDPRSPARRTRRIQDLNGDWFEPGGFEQIEEFSAEMGGYAIFPGIAD